MQGDADENARGADERPTADDGSDERIGEDADGASDGAADVAVEGRGDGGEGSESVDGVDTEHVMNLTFVLTLLIGVPVVVVLSLFVPLDGWNEIISFVVRVGAGIWFLTAVGLYVRERLRS